MRGFEVSDSKESCLIWLRQSEVIGSESPLHIYLLIPSARCATEPAFGDDISATFQLWNHFFLSFPDYSLQTRLILTLGFCLDYLLCRYLFNTWSSLLYICVLVFVSLPLCFELQDSRDFLVLFIHVSTQYLKSPTVVSRKLINTWRMNKQAVIYPWFRPLLRCMCLNIHAWYNFKVTWSTVSFCVHGSIYMCSANCRFSGFLRLACLEHMFVHPYFLSSKVY